MKGVENLINSNIDHLINRTFLYSYILSQPFTVYVDAYPIIENKLLLESNHLQFGYHSESVRILQKKLKKLDFYRDKADGKYDVITEYALKKFQAEHGIRITGIADQETINLVVEEEINLQLDLLDSLPEKFDPRSDHESVRLIQEVLHYLGYYKGEIDGLYGPLSEEAVALADKKHKLNLSKKLDKEPIKQIVKEVQENLPKVKELESEKEKQKDIKIINKSEKLLDTARSLIGSPYHWGGRNPSGFDCSGFIQYVFEKHKILLPRTVSDIWNFSSPISTPSTGDLVFFETYKAGPSHLGIYIGKGQFIHAGLSKGVEIANMDQQYWRERYIGAKRVE